MHHFRRSRLVRDSRALAVLAFSFCAACGNGSSSSGGNPPPPPGDSLPPAALIQAPVDDCLTDAAQVRMTIAARDDTGIAAVSVGGTPAIRDVDGLFKATVPLATGDNTLVVATRDTLGNASSNAARLRIRREASLWIEPSSVAFDELAGEAIVLDPEARALFAVDPVTGARSLVSGAGVGSGPAFQAPRDLAFFEGMHSVVVTEQDSVLRVDLGIGTRTTLSSASVGSGPFPLDLRGIAVDAGRNRALVVDDTRAELMAVDLVTGARTTLSATLLGSGPPLDGPRGVAVDLARNRALVTALPARALVAIDLGNGNRTILSGSTTGGGPDFVAPRAVVVDVFRDRALVADPGAGALFEVELGTGARSILSSSPVGSGEAWLAPTGVALHLGSVPLVTDGATDALFQVGSVSGDRVVVTRVARAAGPKLVRPAALVDGLTAPERLVVADRAALLTMVVATGERSLLSGPGRGSGPGFDELVDVAVAGGSFPCIAVLDAGRRAVLGVDPASGNRRVISDDAVGPGPVFVAPRRLALEFDVTSSGCASTAVVYDEPPGQPAVLLRVNLVSGERTVLSDPTHGTGPDVVDPVALEVDPATTSIHALDAAESKLVVINPVTGDRIVLRTFLPGFADPTDMVLDLAHNRILVTEGAGGVLSGNLLFGGVTLLSGEAAGSGPSFGSPAGIELLVPPTLPQTPITPIAYVLDATRGCVTAVETRAGERAIRSK